MEIPDKTQGLINGQPKTSHVTVSNQQQLLWVYRHRSCQANLVSFPIRSPTQPLKERAKRKIQRHSPVGGLHPYHNLYQETRVASNLDGIQYIEKIDKI